MASLPYAGIDQLDEMLRRSPFPESTHPGNVFRMLAQTPPVGAGALTLIYAVLTGAKLDPRLREMVILRVAQRSDASYALAQHTPIALSEGVGDAQVESLRQGQTPDVGFSEREQVGLAFADQILDASEVSADTFARVSGHFSPREVVELLLTAGCFWMMCRLVTILHLEPEPPFGVDALRGARQAGMEN